KADYTATEHPWTERYAAISEELVKLGSELRTLKEKSKLGLTAKEKARKKQLRKDMKTAAQAFQAYLEKLKAAFEKAGTARFGEFREKNLEKLKPLQTVLRDFGESAVLIHYLATEDKLRIILTTPDMLLARNAEIGKKELNRLIFDFRENLKIMTKYSFIRQSKALYEHLIGPIAEDLKQSKAKTLMLSLDGTLRYIPMSALHDGKQYLAERYATVLYTEAAKPNLKDRPAP
ncbi:MAG: CHAT domain-containing protein, partial [Gammaproteobacteria bacterium]|nr:CHAT domain-containing protein [Gammaproteobacteria bacterium]